MGLIKDGQKALYFPRKDDFITVITLDNLKVTDIEFTDKLYMQK
jgi:ribosomal protein L13